MYFYAFRNAKDKIQILNHGYVMAKIKGLLLLMFVFVISDCFAWMGSDGSYFWNSTGITYSLNDKTELYFGNKDHYSNQSNSLDYYHFELIGYRKLSKQFSIGLGIRQTENYKSNGWNPGQTYMFYGVYLYNPWNMKIKFANRLTTKFSKTADNQYGLDNISNIDFFTKSKWKFPKPYLADELFSNLNSGKVQTIRIYGGFHVLKKENWGIDLFYCNWQTRSTAADWKAYNVLGISTKVKI
jgi:hypothetical protein